MLELKRIFKGLSTLLADFTVKLREVAYAHSCFHVTRDSAVNVSDMISSLLSHYGEEMFVMDEGEMETCFYKKYVAQRT